MASTQYTELPHARLVEGESRDLLCSGASAEVEHLASRPLSLLDRQQIGRACGCAVLLSGCLAIAHCLLPASLTGPGSGSVNDVVALSTQARQHGGSIVSSPGLRHDSATRQKAAADSSWNHGAEDHDDDGDEVFEYTDECDCSWASQFECSKSSSRTCYKACCQSSRRQCLEKERGSCSCDCSWASKDSCKRDDGGCCWDCCCGFLDTSFRTPAPAPQECFNTKDLSVLEEPDTLWCFALMVPGSYEKGLMNWQLEQKVNIFACDSFQVYSNESFELAPGLFTDVVDVDLTCRTGGDYNTALNTPIFVKVWEKVVADGEYSFYAWTVKVDPDTVFLPWRLRVMLAEYKDDSKGTFLNNCKFGLHGPIEVLSRDAVSAWAKGKERCDTHFEHVCKGPCPFGEDMYLDRCLTEVLGVRRANNSFLLMEKDCDPPQGWACDDQLRVAFHPYKSIAEYSRCVELAAQACPDPLQYSAGDKGKAPCDGTSRSYFTVLGRRVVEPCTTSVMPPEGKAVATCDTACATLAYPGATCSTQLARLTDLGLGCHEAHEQVLSQCSDCESCQVDYERCSLQSPPSSPQAQPRAAPTVVQPSTAPRTAAPQYDCNAELEFWTSAWSDAKKSWCCLQTGRGCEVFDCSTEAGDWQTAWSEVKMKWCCENERKGCSA